MKHEGSFHLGKYTEIKNTYLAGDYRKAKKLLDEYLKEHPTDDVAVFTDVKVLEKIGSFGKARKEVLRLLKTIDDERDTLYYNSVLMHYIFILLEEENYKKALEVFENSNIEEAYSGSFDILRLKVYLYKKNDRDLSEFKDIDLYSIKQEIDYNRCVTLCHILNRHYNSQDNCNFNLDARGIIELFLRAEEILQTGVVKSPWFKQTDHYVFSVPNCGTARNSKDIDYLKVVTGKNNTDIFTMFPYYDINPSDIVNDFPLQETDKLDNVVPITRVRRKTQIEKFNDRYNIK